MIPNKSSWNTFPTDENPFGKFKFSSVRIQLDKDLQ